MKWMLWFIKSDIEIKFETCWYPEGDKLVNKIDGFKFYSKNPFSKKYKYHATIGLENTYTILSLIQDGIKNKRKAVRLDVTGGWGREYIYIWKGSYKKAEDEMFKMIKLLQEQY